MTSNQMLASEPCEIKLSENLQQAAREASPHLTCTLAHSVSRHSVMEISRNRLNEFACAYQRIKHGIDDDYNEPENQAFSDGTPGRIL